MELRRKKLKAESQYPIKVSYKEEVIGEYYADIIVEDSIILEIKAVDSLQPIHEAQLLNYLRATGLTIGLLINFKHTKAEIRRLVWSAEE